MFVKICGITTEEDALVAVGMGADALGFNFVPGSVRQISPAQARDIRRRLPAGVMSVGIFRNELPARVVEIANEVGLDAVQLHGNEGVEDTNRVAQSVQTTIKVFSAGDPALDRLDRYNADVVMIDAPEPGSGRVFDWSVLDGRERGLPLLLAGGLNPDNVESAIETVRPWGVDVATGVEASPGRKDPLKVRAFVSAAKEAGARLNVDSAAPASTEIGPYDWRDE